MRHFSELLERVDSSQSLWVPLHWMGKPRFEVWSKFGRMRLHLGVPCGSVFLCSVLFLVLDVMHRWICLLP